MLTRIFVTVRRRWYVIASICFLGLVSMPFLAMILPNYKATAQLLTVSDGTKDTTLADQTLPSIIASTEVLEAVIKRLHLKTDPSKLGTKIKTKIPTKSAIVEVSYSDPDGNLAATIANTVADQAVIYYKQVASQGYEEVNRSLVSQIAKSKARVADFDRQLQHVSAKNAVASSDNALSDLTTQFDALRAQRNQVNASLAADVATVDALSHQQAIVEPIARGEILQKDVVYQQAQLGYAKDMGELVSERATFTDAFPGLRALATRISRERVQLASIGETAVASGSGLSPSATKSTLDRAAAIAVVAADRERLKAIDQEIQVEQSHLREIADVSATVGTLRGEHDATLQQYTALVQRLAAAQGDAAQTMSLGSLVVVSRAIPGPSRLWIFLLVAGFAIILIAVGAAYAVDTFDKRFWGSGEIETVYGRPLLLNVGIR